MRDSLQERCSLFVKNRNTIKSSFGWESAYIYPLCASIVTAKGEQANVTHMKNCLGLLKEKTGIFSNFRGTSKMATVTMLSLVELPEKQLEKILSAYDALKQEFFGSEYLATAAVAIAELAQSDDYGQMARHTRAIYNRMKDAHPFLTSGEDSTFAALLALSGLNDMHIEQEMEKCYKILKPSFFSGNAVQSLSNVLALGDEPAEKKCQKVTDIYTNLKNRGHKYGTSYELATLGVLALLDTDIHTLATDIMEVDDFLKGQKGFGMLGIGSKQRLMYAGMLTMQEYMPETQTMQMAALNGVVALIIAEQTAMIAAIMAANAAAAASSSNS